MKYNEEVRIDLLQKYERNARIHDHEQILALMKSITEFGFVAPVVIDENNMILVGHGRIEAAKRLGLKTVPCVYVEHLTEEQKRAYIHADNLLTEKGGWDFDILRSELDEIGMDMTEFGFDGAEASIDEIKTAEEKSSNIRCPKCGCEFDRKEGRNNE